LSEEIAIFFEESRGWKRFTLRVQRADLEHPSAISCNIDSSYCRTMFQIGDRRLQIAVEESGGSFVRWARYV
jgi:hypothetical protein